MSSHLNIEILPGVAKVYLSFKRPTKKIDRHVSQCRVVVGAKLSALKLDYQIIFKFEVKATAFSEEKVVFYAKMYP